MAETGFQGKKLGEVSKIWEKMISDPEVTIIMGFSGSMSTTGQSKIINWLIENRFIDVLVSTGANISEDIIIGMGYDYWQGSHLANDTNLLKKNINCIVSTAAKHGVPIFCPAIVDSPYGDAALLAQREYGKKIVIDQVVDFTEWIKLGENFKKSGVIYIGGGVPKDFIQISAVSSALLYKDKKQKNRGNGQVRTKGREYFYPHSYAIQIT